MRICTICREPFYRQTEIDPAESCFCGAMADGTPWAWDRWRGVYNAVLYWIARQCYALGNCITKRGGYR